MMVIVSVNWLFQVLLWIPSSISFGLTLLQPRLVRAPDVYQSSRNTAGNRTEEGSKTPDDCRGPFDAGIPAGIRLRLMD